MNTVAPRGTSDKDRLEYLAEPAELLAWAVRVDLVDPAERELVATAWRAAPTAAAQALHAASEIREATSAVLASRVPQATTDQSPVLGDPAATLETLSLRWAAASARSELVMDDGPGVARLQVGTNPASMIPDRLARLAVELVCTVELGRLKACPLEAGGCGWLFLDLSRNGSRRWCSMADCGTVAKSRRLTINRRSRATSKKA